MSQFFDTFLRDEARTPYAHPNVLPPQPEILDKYRNRVTMTGDVHASGDSNNLVTTIAPTGVKAGVYSRVRVNAKGQVIEGLTELEVQQRALTWENIEGKPTTIAGAGITDVYNKAEVGSLIAGAVQQINPPLATKLYTFAAQVQWRVIHNMGTRNISETIINAEGHRIYANITIVDANEFLIDFSSAEAGTVSVIFNMDE